MGHISALPSRARVTPLGSSLQVPATVDEAVAALLGDPDSDTAGVASASLVPKLDLAGKTAAQITAFLAIGGPVCLFGTAAITDEITVPDGVHINATGATINFSGTGTTTPCFRMGNNTSLIGATINMSNQAGGLGPRAHVLIGNYGTGVGVSNVHLSGLTITGGHDDINPIFITGDSHNVVIENIKVPDNARIGRVIEAHWGNSNNHNTTGPTHTGGTYTKHPHNITIRNVECGELTYAGYGAAVVLLSAAYNVTIENVRAKACDVGFYVFPSDFGFVYAEAEVTAIGASGISIRNCTFRKVRVAGVRVKGQPLSETSARNKVRVLVENVRVEGDGVTANSVGMDFTHTEHATVRGCHASVFRQHGFIASTDARDTTFEDCHATNNYWSGFAAIGSSGNEPKHTRIIGCRAYGNATSTTSDEQRAGVAFQAAHYTTVRDCILGDEGVTETQKFGVYAYFNTLYATITGNSVRNVAASGTGIYTDVALSDQVRAFDNAYLGAFTKRNSGALTRQNVDDDTGWTEVGSGGSAPAFQNSWVNFGGGYATAGYRKVGSQVFLKGVIKSGSSSLAFTLPSGYRPTQLKEFNAYSGTTNPGALCHVNTTGAVDLFNYAAGEVSLEGVSFFTD
jgi:hypothetical protein